MLAVENEAIGVEDALRKAKNMSTIVTEFSKPLNRTTVNLAEVQRKGELLDKKLDDVGDIVSQAQGNTTAVVGISQKVK